MIIAGIRTFSFVDYPGKISAVLYTGGCNFRCSWCHNWKIAYADDYKKLNGEEVLNKLKGLRKRLNAICITGGEPTIHKDLPDLIRKIKNLGYSVKLDTNGTNPEMLRELVESNLIDYVAMDIKADFKNYTKLISRNYSFEKEIKESIDILRNLNINYEFRMTYVPGLSKEEDVEFFEEFLLPDEKGYITIANSTEIFEINKKGIDLNVKKLILR
ncbi:MULTISPECIES: anaerobic ribonucleoside-triphosphate reductase activating protein [unclassified Marinitoga]|uniref:anaerobic ribonucleoside-triphosphate reductase activating protein n=1 Tax=unclassified Marinitoga TaxID=2640159 RepID=UPI000952B21A|nr:MULTISPECIES: anaerobic ribonucleoside-triphosphate reductase activating protein [unclassified Marinitoga]